MGTPKKKAAKKKVYTSSITGKRVSKAYAEANPDTTYGTTVKERKK